MERRLIEESLLRQHGNVTKAAELLGISRQTMRYRIEKFGVDTEV
jgi:two-component system, NtrC family, response regulator AtoC